MIRLVGAPHPRRGRTRPRTPVFLPTATKKRTMEKEIVFNPKTNKLAKKLKFGTAIESRHEARQNKPGISYRTKQEYIKVREEMSKVEGTKGKAWTATKVLAKDGAVSGIKGAGKLVPCKIRSCSKSVKQVSCT